MDVTLNHKSGSLQEFVKSIGPIENFSPDLFSVDEIHKIAVLDLRLLNLDRNACNILVQNAFDAQTGKEYKKLVPIDHGMTVPDSLEICSYDLVWLSFEQAELPFSPKTLQYIQKLNIDHDIAYLESNFKIRPQCLRNIKISTLLLQRGASRGLTLAQIG